MAAAVDLLPQMRACSILRQWAGTNDMTMDGARSSTGSCSTTCSLNAGWCYGGFKAIPASGAACATLVARATRPIDPRISPGAICDGSLLDERGAGPFPRGNETLLGCPFCGPREFEEFRIPQRPCLNAGDGITAMTLRAHRKRVQHREHWQHVRGVVRGSEIHRNPSTGAVLETETGSAERT